jgi:hypothetical protein
MMVLLVKVTAIDVRLSASLSTRVVAGNDRMRIHGLSATRLACAPGALAERARLARSLVGLPACLEGPVANPEQGAAL